MKIPRFGYRCALAKDYPESMDVEAVKKNGWREQRILVVAESDARLGIIEREFVRQIGERLYGEPTLQGAKRGRCT